MTTDTPFPDAAVLDAHLRETDDLLRQLGSDAHKGLSTAQAQQRLATVGANALVETGQRHPLRILLAQFGDFIILVLLVAAVIAGLIGEPQDVVAIAVIVVLSVGLQMAVLYVPWLNTVFKTEPLSAFELLLCFLLAGVLFVAVEIEKLLVRRGWIYKS